MFTWLLLELCEKYKIKVQMKYAIGFQNQYS